MSGTEASRLIQLTSARLRHQLDRVAGPLQAPTTTAEPIRSASAPPPSAAAATGHANLLHAAWGADEHPLSIPRLQTLTANLPHNVAVDPSGLDQSCVFLPYIGRIVLNLLLLAAASLPAGGTVTLAGSADDLFLQIDGPRGAWPAGMAACVVNEAAARAALDHAQLDPTQPPGAANSAVAMVVDHRVQMPLTALLAHASGVRLSFLMAPSGQTGPPILRLGGS